MVGLFLLVAGLWWMNTLPVAAHAALISASPENDAALASAPTEVVLQFSEPVGIVDGGTSLHGSETEPIMLDPVVSDSTVRIPIEVSLADGAYVLQWRVISADSHAISGTLSFTVGDAEAGAISIEGTPGWIDPGLGIATGIKYIGMLGALGVLIMGLLIARTDVMRLLGIVWVFVIIGLIGAALEVPFVAMEQAGESFSGLSQTFDLFRAVDVTFKTANALIVLSLLVALISIRMAKAATDVWLCVAALLSAHAGLLLTGHTRSREPVAVMMIADSFHLVAAAAWFGGIVLLVMGLRARSSLQTFADDDSARDAVGRFSSIASLILVVVGISGSAMAMTILDSWRAFVESDFGRVLILKIALVIVIAILGAANRFVVIPRLPRHTQPARIWLRRLVLVELSLLIAVGGVTGWLVQQSPIVTAEITDEGAIVFDERVSLDDDHELHLTLQLLGNDQVDVTGVVYDESGDPMLLETELVMSWSLPAEGLGPMSVALPHDHVENAFRGTVDVPIAGEWQVELKVDIDQFTDSRATITVEVPDN